MISFLWVHLFYPKKKLILWLSIVVMFGILSLLIDPFHHVLDEYLFPSSYLYSYETMMIKIMTLMMPFMIIICVMDHDQLYLRPLYSYFGRSHVIVFKTIVYILMITFLYLSLMVYYYALFYLFKPHLSIFVHIKTFVHLYLDAIILLIFVLYLIRDKYKMFSIIFGILYMINQFIQEDVSHLGLYYLFPFKNEFFESYMLAIPYKLCYISLGLILTHRKMCIEPLSTT